MGRSLLEWLRNYDGAHAERVQACAGLPPTYPVAFALAEVVAFIEAKGMLTLAPP